MPNTKEELYLAAILGEYSGELPMPNTKVECYLYKLAKDGVPGGSGGGTVDLSEYAKKEDLVGQKTADGGEIFNDYENNVASGKYSHAEGIWTTASGDSSHAEGGSNFAIGNYSHVEGRFSRAVGHISHAEGAGTVASGYQSHAEGWSTIAGSDIQHVQGKFNVEDTDGKYAFIIGNGTENDRSNAIAIDWDGLFYLNNSDTGIDLSEISGEVAQTTEKVAQLDSSVSSLNRKTIKFRHGKGTFNATATGTNIVWKYGSQEIQGESCTFDVKSDNGLIIIEFDEITKITINNDALNKLCLSDLGGNITNGLSLSDCSQITGDLSDLGGKITNTLGLYNCSQITGDLSDLGGNITNSLSLYNCSQITGDLSDLGGNITNNLNLINCSQITGDLSDLGGKITNTLGLSNCSQITGDLSDLGGNITNQIDLYNCSQITGDLSDLGGKITNTLSLSNCSQITGVYYGTKYPTRFAVSNTAITANDMDQNLINFSNSTAKNGTFTATNMTRTAASDDAIATLVANGWTVSGLTKVEV